MAGIVEGRYKVTWKREFKLQWRKAGLLISIIKWSQTSRLSIKISLSRIVVDRLLVLEVLNAPNIQGLLEIKDTRRRRTLGWVYE